MKMKYKILLMALALFAATTMDAEPTQVSLTVKTTNNNGNLPRTPVPLLYLDGHTLTASDNTVDSTINIKDADDKVVFSTYVYIEGDIALPVTLSGTYVIEVVRGDLTFIGEIEL